MLTSQAGIARLAALGRNRRPGISTKQHIIELGKYVSLGLMSGNPSFELQLPAAGSPKLQKGSRWSYFSNELNYTVQHIHPRDYLRAPVVARTTANPRNSPTTRVAPTCWAEGTVKELSNLLAKSYPATTVTQWENLLAKSQCTTEGLFQTAGLAPELYQDTRLIELGSGFGAHSFVNAERTRSRLNNLNFDIPEMLALQQNVLKYLRWNSGNYGLCSKLSFTSSHEELFKEARRDTYAIVSHYAYTEFSLAERERMVQLIADASFVCLVANQHYEGLSNYDYISELANRVGKTLHLGPVCNPNQEKHTRNHTAYLLV